MGYEPKVKALPCRRRAPSKTGEGGAVHRWTAAGGRCRPAAPSLFYRLPYPALRPSAENQPATGDSRTALCRTPRRGKATRPPAPRLRRASPSPPMVKRAKQGLCFPSLGVPQCPRPLLRYLDYTVAAAPLSMRRWKKKRKPRPCRPRAAGLRFLTKPFAAVYNKKADYFSLSSTQSFASWMFRLEGRGTPLSGS